MAGENVSSLQVPKSSLSIQDQGKYDAMRFGTDMVRLIETLLDDAKAENILKTEGMGDIWLPVMKSLKLTFFNETDAHILYIQFEEAVLDLMLYRRRGEFTLKDSMIINQLRMLFRANCKRSVGTSPDTLNERVLQASSFTHSTGVYKEATKPGLAAKVAGFFGRG